jgi:predicted phage baseplate assembly protein
VTISAPNLDDRTFQDLVDDAKRYVQARCPRWSDHNVSDPGVTLIETFAMITDQMIYRLNRVPDRLYVQFLNLLGVRLFPPKAAVAPVTFWLSAPQQETVTVRAETEVATQRNGDDPPVVFHTTDDLDILPCSLISVATAAGPNGTDPIDRSELWQAGEPFSCFSPQPAVGDALYIGLSTAVPRCAVAVRFSCEVEGEGVDPRRPPRVWEAWTGERWEPCELERDETGGFNLAGDVVLHVPAGHTPSVQARRRAGWLRCRVVTPSERDQPFYRTSPRIRGASAFTIGGTTDAEHAETVRDEIVGLAEGTPGQRLQLSRRPVVRGATPMVVEVAEQDGWQQWTEVDHFSKSGEHDRHVVLDLVTGEIVFGPWIRQADGSLRKYGAVPPKAAPVRVRAYQIGGGRRGNVARGTITALRSSVPFVAQVENRRPAGGGVDGEDVESAKQRAPLLLRSRQRAVTAEDYEYLAREADPQVARARCVPGEGADAAVVRVLIVPALESVDSDGGQPRPFEALRPSAQLLRSVTEFLDERRVLGTRLNVEPPFYRGVTAVVRLRARARVEPTRVLRAARAMLYRYLDPLRGGPDGAGWPFGRAVQAGELFAALQAVSGIELVEEIRLYQADPVTQRRSSAWTTQVELKPNDLPFSVEHYVEVVPQ